MKLITQKRFEKRLPTHLICEINLYEVIGESGVAQYLVKVRQGASTSKEWSESTLTAQPVAKARAELVFESAVLTKLEQGFVEQLAATKLALPGDSENALSPATPNTSVISPAAATANQSARSATTVLLSRLQPNTWNALAAEKKSRTVWRLGELVNELQVREAAPQLVALIETGNPMLDYCIAWSLGRMGDSGAVEALKALSARSKTPAVARMAKIAWLRLTNDSDRETHAKRLIDDWPADLRAAWVSDGGISKQNEQLQGLINAAPTADSVWQKLPLPDWLTQLDEVSQATIFATKARTILLEQLRTIAVKAGHFKALRQLYKAAEFRDDAELWGLLHVRLENAPPGYFKPTYGDSKYINGKYVSVKEELARANSRLAFSQDTRRYFLNRSWRTLRKLGEANDGKFVVLATGALLAFRDTDAKQERVVGRYVQNEQGSGWKMVYRQHSPYSQWSLFNHLLHTNSETIQRSRSGLSWWVETDNNPADPAERERYLARHQKKKGIQPKPVEAPSVPKPKREEAFPQLWDAVPDSLLKLLLKAQCNGVHAFAALALEANTSYCSGLSAETLMQLLRSPYSAAAQFALTQTRQRIEAAQSASEKLPWVLALLQSSYELATALAIEIISAEPASYAKQAQLIVALLTHTQKTVSNQGRVLVELAAKESVTANEIVNRLLAWMGDASVGGVHVDEPLGGESLDHVCKTLQWVIQHPLLDDALRAPHSVLNDHLRHAQPAIVELAVAWLLLSASANTSVSTDVPTSALSYLLAHENHRIRAAGARLFGALDERVVLQQGVLVAQLCASPDQTVREAIAPVVVKNAGSIEFTNIVLEGILPHLFRAETGDGLHADLLKLCHGPLSEATMRLDDDTQWRLLQARAGGASKLGAAIVLKRDRHAFTVKQWAQMGKHDDVMVRRYACTAFAAEPEKVHAQLQEALTILDSRWDDARDFVVQFFTQSPKNIWTPECLVALCDHLHPSVQRLGRDLLTQTLHAKDAMNYLQQLSQHPSANMQLFVSDWLVSQFAANSAIDEFLAFKPYFLSVLSKVNRSRVLKDRVHRFLRDQAQRSPEHANVVADIFARCVLTVALADKAQYIAGLRDIQSAHPSLESPLKAQAVMGSRRAKGNRLSMEGAR